MSAAKKIDQELPFQPRGVLSIQQFDDSVAISRNRVFSQASEIRKLAQMSEATTNSTRRLNPDVVDLIKRSEIPRILVPKSRGGLELGVGFLSAVVQEIGQGCCSTAWNVGLYANNPWIACHFSDRAQDDFFSSTANPLCSLMFAAKGQLTPTNGGYRLTGRWPFVSGSVNADWVLLGAMLQGSPTPKAVCALVRMKDVKIEDTWHVSGLQGTGSNDLILKDVFVDEHRVVDSYGLVNHTWEGKPKGPSILNLPFYATAIAIHCPPAVGAAFAAIELFKINMANKKVPHANTPMLESAVVQSRLAEAWANAQAARLLLQEVTSALDKCQAYPDLSPELERASWRLQLCTAADAAKKCVDSLFTANGGSALFLSNRMQQIHRDVIAIANHANHSLDVSRENFGRLLLGFPPSYPMM